MKHKENHLVSLDEATVCTLDEIVMVTSLVGDREREHGYRQRMVNSIKKNVLG